MSNRIAVHSIISWIRQSERDSNASVKSKYRKMLGSGCAAIALAAGNVQSAHAQLVPGLLIDLILGRIAVGTGSSSTSINGVAIGTNSQSTAEAAVALGTANAASGNTSVAIGRNNSAAGQASVAIGSIATANATNAIAIGNSTQATANGSIAIGGGGASSPSVFDITAAAAASQDAIAIGTSSFAESNGALALGVGANASGAGNIALGAGSTASLAHIGNVVTNGGVAAGAGVAGVVSVGAAGVERQIQNVGAGVVSSLSTDAVNGSQLFAVANAATNLGSSLQDTIGGTTVIGADGSLSAAPVFNVAGSSFGTVAGALQAADAKATMLASGVATALGSGAGFGLDGTIFLPNYLVRGGNFSNVGLALNALDGGIVDLELDLDLLNGGIESGTMGLVQQQGGSPGSGLITVGANTGGSAISLTGMGGNRVLGGIARGNLGALSDNAVTGGQVFGLAASIAAHLGGSAIFDPITGAISTPSITVGGVTFTNAGAAILAGDAKTSLLGSGIATALGGGSGVSVDGAVSRPVYTIQGTTHSSIGTAFTAVDGTLDSLNGMIDTLGTSAPGLVRQTAGGAITVGAATGGNGIDIAGTAGARTVTGLGIGNTQAGSSDAVTGGQINTLASSVAAVIGGSAYDSATGAVTSPGFTVEGTTYSSVSDALSAIVDDVVTINNQIAGGGIKYFHTNSTLADSASVGVNAVAVGPGANAIGSAAVAMGLRADANSANSVAIGTDATATGGASVAIGLGQLASGNGAVAIGDPNSAVGTGAVAIGADNAATGTGAVALGNLNQATGDGSVAIGNNASATLAGSVALGNGAVAATVNSGAYTLNGGSIAATTPVAVASFGSAGNERQLQNVAAGVLSASSTDAVNGSQLFAVASAVNNINAATTTNGAKSDALGAAVAAALGAGAGYDGVTGQVTAPAYAVQGGAHDNVGSALAAVDNNLTTLSGTVAGLANGTAGLVQQTAGAPGTGPITIGAGTGGSVVNVAGTAGNRTIAGVADGAVAAGSNEAVTGGQLFAVSQSVNAAAASSAATSTNIGSSVASALGGGASYDTATGQVVAPSYTVGGISYGNAGAALAATNLLAVQYVADNGGQPSNLVRLVGSGDGQSVTLTNVAPGLIGIGSTDAVNGAQLHAVSQVANGALQTTGGTMTGNLAMSGNRITGVGAPQDADDVATKGYVDALQSLPLQQMANLTTGLNSAFRRIERNSQGVALAMALGGGYLLPESKFAVFGGWGNFDGKNALAAQSYIRVSKDVSLNAGLSLGLEEGLVGSRVGFGIQF